MGKREFKSIDVKPSVKKCNTVQSRSALLVLSDSVVGEVFGYLYRWDRDMAGHHIQAEKGDIFFADLEGSLLTGVTGWLFA